MEGLGFLEGERSGEGTGGYLGGGWVVLSSLGDGMGSSGGGEQIG